MHASKYKGKKPLLQEAQVNLERLLRRHSGGDNTSINIKVDCVTIGEILIGEYEDERSTMMDYMRPPLHRVALCITRSNITANNFDRKP